jgi:hypothetical protein
MLDDVLESARTLASDYLRRVRDRVVAPVATTAELRAALAAPLTDAPQDPTAVIEMLARAVEPGLVATPGPRYFGFVNGGVLPAALGADWLTSAWDQNAALHVMSPAASVVESIVAEWVLDLLDLPRSASVGLVTGTQMATFTALAAARHAVLDRVGWDVEARGLQQAPVHVVVSEESRGRYSPRCACSVLGGGAHGSRPTATVGCAAMPCVMCSLNSMGQRLSAPKPAT